MPVPLLDYRPAENAVEPTEAATMVRAMVYLVGLGLFAATMYAYRQGYYQGRPFPSDTFLFSPADHFKDLSNFYLPLDVNDPYSFQFSVYPPFAYLVMEPFSWLRGSAATLLWAGATVAGIALFLARQLEFVKLIDRVAAVAVLTVLTYPFLFAFDRGNIEVFVTLLLALFVFSWQTDRLMLAAVALGAASAIKGYPIIFGLLFLVRGQWRQVLVLLFVGALLSFLGTIYYGFDPLETVDKFTEKLDLYNEIYVIGDAGLGWGCSLFGAVKIGLRGLGGSAETVRDVLQYYLMLSAVLLGGVALALWRLPLVLWEEVTLLTVALNVLPTVSADYKLLHLVLPAALFLRYGAADPWRWGYVLAFGLLLVPKAYFADADGVSLGVVLNPLFMVAIAVAVCVRAAARRSAVAAQESAAYAAA